VPFQEPAGFVAFQDPAGFAAFQVLVDFAAFQVPVFLAPFAGALEVVRGPDRGARDCGACSVTVFLHFRACRLQRV
jgi:hypothetical protein